MRARAIREGSVGLLILVGVGLFLGLVLWLQRLTPGNRAYRLQFDFENSMGIQPGTVVRYRGVPVGRVVTLTAGSNEVQVVVEITDPNLRMPRSVQVEANQGGFIGETTIDITPLVVLAEVDLDRRPTGPDCSGGVILCNGDRLPGTVGVSYESLLRSADRLANLFADPTIVQALKDALAGATDVTGRIASLSDELSALAGDARTEVGPTAAAARSALNNAGAAGQAVQQTAQSFQATAQEFQLTATDVRSLLAANRAHVTNTLISLNRSSDRLLGLLTTVGTAVDRVDPDTLATLTTNLEVLSANAADAALDIRLAAADARALTGSLNTPENRILLQQTLESARAVFQNAQKILADLDELTGDPALRNNIRNLINGLGNLLSTTQTLEQQIALADALGPLATGSSPVTLSYQSLHQQLHRQLEALDTAAPGAR